MDAVIGIGNRLRRDDGIAHEVVDALTSSPGLAVWRVEGLLPESVRCLEGMDRVLFVDADARGDGVCLSHLAPRDGWAGHDLSAEGLLSLAREMFGEAPKGSILTVPGYDFGHGEGLSERAAALLAQAREAAAGWILGKE